MLQTEGMPDTTRGREPADTRVVRDLADRYVESLADINASVAMTLGNRRDDDRVQDLSPEGQDAEDDLSRTALAELDSTLRKTRSSNADERRCAVLLRERLQAQLAASAAGEHLRLVQTIAGPVQRVRQLLMMMPADNADDWAVIGRRMARTSEALTGYVASLQEGVRRGLPAAPRQVTAMVTQLDEWLAAGDGRGWFAGFCADADVIPTLRAELDRAGMAATAAVAELRSWLAEDYLPHTAGTPDGVGADRYRVATRLRMGADVDLEEVYEWGWAEYRRLMAQMREQADLVLRGATVREAMLHLDMHGEAVDGVETIRRRLHDLTTKAIADLDGTYFDFAEPVKVVETMIAPTGSAAAPYYIRPARDFSRPGRTWLPTLGKTRFPLWKLVSTWHHEGVPGHHLQFAHWATVSGQLSTFQTSIGAISATTEGWALYAERLMDELGFHTDPGVRLGYLEAQMRRAIRVIIDIGMHLRYATPSDAPLAPGEIWTADLGRAFLAEHTAREPAFVDSEIVRYLGLPGQAISYKLGERAWLAGRNAARAARGDRFDLKSWHMVALSLGSLGLDDLTGELGSVG
jgi:uncharacterized protein (DUF885 family)